MNRITVHFKDAEDLRRFTDYVAKAKAQDGTVGGLWSGLLCSALKRAELVDVPRAKNPDPTQLNKSNEGDACVVTLNDGSTQSGTITDVTENVARVEFMTGPHPTDRKYVWVRKDLWATRLQLFPAGCNFLVQK